MTSTVVAVGSNVYGRGEVSSWENIVYVSARFGHSVGLKADVTVIVIGDNYSGQCNVSNWSNIGLKERD